jgi:hypothetical protein
MDIISRKQVYSTIILPQGFIVGTWHFNFIPRPLTRIVRKYQKFSILETRAYFQIFVGPLES